MNLMKRNSGKISPDLRPRSGRKRKVTIPSRTGQWGLSPTGLDLDVVETINLIFLVNKVVKPGC